MAKFDQAFLKTSGIEGGYTVDNGGRTYRGISQKAWGNDPIAKKIFAIVLSKNLRQGQTIKNNLVLDSLVKQFYKQRYWDKIFGDQLNNQTLAEFIYDFYVNSNSAIILINKAIGSQRGTNFFTEETINQLNSKPGYCYSKIIEARKNWYKKLATKSTKLKKYFPGWMARISLFPAMLSVKGGIGSIEEDHYNSLMDRYKTATPQQNKRLRSKLNSLVSFNEQWQGQRDPEGEQRHKAIKKFLKQTDKRFNNNSVGSYYGTGSERYTSVINDTHRFLLKLINGNRGLYMIGAKELRYYNNPDEIAFRIPQAKNRINTISISYDLGQDLINMKFQNFHNKNGKLICGYAKLYKGLYLDQVREIFQQETHLYLSL